jgi:hypothetical protein
MGHEPIAAAMGYEPVPDWLGDGWVREGWLPDGWLPDG